MKIVREHWAPGWAGIFQNNWRGAAAEADTIREHQLKWMQSGSSSRSRRNQGAAVEVDAIGEQQPKRTQSGSSSRSGCNRGEQSDAIGEQQLKRIDAIALGVAAETDAIGEQQLCAESCPAPDYSRRQTRGEVAERAKLLVMLGKGQGLSWGRQTIGVLQHQVGTNIMTIGVDRLEEWLWI